MNLLNLFRSPPILSPADWQLRLDQAQHWLDELRYQDIIQDLTPLTSASRLPTPLLPFLTATLGLLGECHFQLGQLSRAVKTTTRALDLAQRAGDLEAQATFLGNLYEIHRYMGSVRAADDAVALAEILTRLGQPSLADRYQRQAKLVRVGEPLLRVVAEVEGQRYEMEELLKGRPGAVRFNLERNRLTLRPAEHLIEQGERDANQGNFESALTLFQQAAQADSHAPQPHYHSGLTLLYLRRPAEAVKALQQAEQRAPGWMMCRPALHLARLLVAGEVDHDTFVAWHALEEGPLNADSKVALAERSLKRSPRLAVLHLLHAKNLRSRGLSILAEGACRRGLACEPTPDVKTRLLVELAAMIENSEERRRLLQQAIDLNGDLIAAATAAVVLAFE